MIFFYDDDVDDDAYLSLCLRYVFILIGLRNLITIQDSTESEQRV